VSVIRKWAQMLFPVALRLTKAGFASHDTDRKHQQPISITIVVQNNRKNAEVLGVDPLRGFVRSPKDKDRCAKKAKKRGSALQLYIQKKKQRFSLVLADKGEFAQNWDARSVSHITGGGNIYRN